MKRFLVSTAVLATLASPAMAWDAQTGGSGPQAIGQDGGSATAQQQHQTANANARSASRSSATGGNASATGGKGGSSNVSVNNSVGGGGGNSGGGGGRAPDVFIPSVGGGGSDCPTVGFGAGGSGLGGGGGLGPSWISSDCNKRKVTDLLATLFGADVARAYAVKNIDGVKEAVDASTPPRPAYAHPAWCVESKGRWLRDLPECGEDPR